VVDNIVPAGRCRITRIYEAAPTELITVLAFRILCWWAAGE
jgi:hypothetical protein